MNAATISRGAWIAAWIVVLVLMHYSVRPLLAWRVQVDFLMIALLVIAVRTRPGIAAFCGFALGVVTDSLAPGSFGVGALAMTIVAFASSWLKAAFFTENILLNAAFVFAGKWAFDIVFVLGQGRLGIADIASQLLLWSPVAAAATAVVGLGVLVVSRPTEVRRR